MGAQLTSVVIWLTDGIRNFQRGLTIKRQRKMGRSGDWNFWPCCLEARCCWSPRFVVRIIRITSRTFKKKKKNTSAQLISWLNFSITISRSRTQHMFLKITSRLSLICIEGWETVLQPVRIITPPVICWVPTGCRVMYSVTHQPHWDRRQWWWQGQNHSWCLLSDCFGPGGVLSTECGSTIFHFHDHPRRWVLYCLTRCYGNFGEVSNKYQICDFEQGWSVMTHEPNSAHHLCL